MSCRRDSWWSQMSIASSPISPKSIDKNRLFRQQSTFTNLKKNFFPNSELQNFHFKIFLKILIDADSKFKLVWDLIIMFQTIILSFTVPYSLSFFQDFPIRFLYFTSALFILDVFISFNTTVYCEGSLIKSHKMIANYYMKTDLFVDILAGFPFEFFFLDILGFSETTPRSFEAPREYMRLLLLLKMLKLYKVSKTMYQLHIHFPQSTFYTFIQLFIYFLWVALVSHWITCLFNILYSNALKSYEYYTRPILQDSRSRYLRILERVVQTMTSVGYGEFNPKTDFEILFNIVVMSITSGLLGIFVGAINNEIEKSSATSIFFRQALHQFHVFMRLHKIPQHLRVRIKDYLRCLQISYSEHLIRDQDIFELLSMPLREQIFLYTRGYVLVKINQFQDLSPATLKALGYKLILNFYAPKDLILRQTERTSELYFIFQGSVSVVHHDTLTEFAELKRGNFFGEIGFFTSNGRTASVISKNFSEVFSLSKQIFRKIIQLVPKDNEKILTIMRNLRTYGISYIGIRCYLCDIVGHVAKDCQKSIYKPNMRKIVKKFRENREKGVRSYYQRIDKSVDLIKKYGIHNTKGCFKQENTELGERVYLMRQVRLYSNSVSAIKSENNHFFTIVNELDEENPALKDSESDDSERNFLHFSVAQLENKPPSPTHSNSFQFIFNCNHKNV